MADVFHGKKKFVTREQAQKAYCPQIAGKLFCSILIIVCLVGLHMKDLLREID